VRVLVGRDMAKKAAEVPRPEDDRSGRKTAPIQVEKELARMVAVIAAHRQISQGELISPVIRSFVVSEYRKTQAAMGRELDREPPPA
jgi:hypothetical protein